MDRRVLVIAYLFPPTGGGGVQRITKFVHYLAEFGWHCTVLTTRWDGYPAQDASQLTELPAGTRVLRTRDPGLARLMAGPLEAIGGLRASGLAAWPDYAQLWVPGAVRAGRRVLAAERHDALMSTSPPFSTHIVGERLARSSGLPWVADFRDAWADNPTRVSPYLIPRHLEEALERRLLRWAAHVTAVHDHYVIAGSDGEGPTRTTIPNGVDERDLAPSGAVSGDRFTLSFVGSLYADIDAAPVIRAARRLVERGVIDARRFEIRLVGNVWVERLEDPGPVQISRPGYVDHRKAVQEMADSTALLIYVPRSSRSSSAKAFEYLASERPVLCVTRSDNPAFPLVRDWNAGIAVEPEDEAGIEAALETLYTSWEAGTLQPAKGIRERTLARYSRRALTGELARILDSVSG